MLPADAKSQLEMLILLDAKRMWDYLANIGTFKVSRHKRDNAVLSTVEGHEIEGANL